MLKTRPLWTLEWFLANIDPACCKQSNNMLDSNQVGRLTSLQMRSGWTSCARTKERGREREGERTVCNSDEPFLNDVIAMKSHTYEIVAVSCLCYLKGFLKSGDLPWGGRRVLRRWLPSVVHRIIHLQPYVAAMIDSPPWNKATWKTDQHLGSDAFRRYRLSTNARKPLLLRDCQMEVVFCRNSHFCVRQPISQTF